jgi:hypothetical protein
MLLRQHLSNKHEHHLSAIVCRKVFLRISCGMSWNLFRRIWSHTLMKWKCGPPTNLNCMMKYTVKSLEGDNLKTWWTLKETGNALPFHFCLIRLNGRPDWSDIIVCIKELIHASVHVKYNPNVQGSNQAHYHARFLRCFPDPLIAWTFYCSSDSLSTELQGHCITREIWIHTVHHPLSSSLFQPYSSTSGPPSLHGPYCPGGLPIPFSKTVQSILGNSFVFESFCRSVTHRSPDLPASIASSWS